MLQSRLVGAICSAISFVLPAGIASGQDYPNKPIRIITGAPGGGNDFAARIMAQGISGSLGQPVIVENRGQVATSAEPVAKAPPDGYTLFVGGASLWVAPLLQKMPYDAVRDFSPLSTISRDVYVVAVHPSLPVRSVKDLVALARARPGQLNFASDAIGGTVYLRGELFKSLAGVNIVNIPYKGNALGIAALISGEVQVIIVDAGLVLPQAKAGKLRALAVTSAEPTALAPGLPTVAASGLPDYESVGWTGMLATAKTPVTIINRLNQEIVRLLNRADVKEQFFNRGSEVVSSTPAQFAATIQTDIANTTKVIKNSGIKVD